MEKNVQEILASMSDVLSSQQEAIDKQQAEIEQLKAGGMLKPEKSYIADKGKKAKASEAVNSGI